MKTIEEMIEILKHYTNEDVMNWTIYQIIEAYTKLEQ